LIDTKLGPLASKAEEERRKIVKNQENAQELAEKIKMYIAKFDTLKDDMANNSKQFETYQSDIELKKLEMTRLETEN